MERDLNLVQTLPLAGGLGLVTCAHARDGGRPPRPPPSLLYVSLIPSPSPSSTQFVAICVLYYLTAILIFVVAKAREPDLCARAGVENCLAATTQRMG